MDEKVIGYCVKCRVKPGREMKDVKVVEIKPGRPAAKGFCTVCGTGMYKILNKEVAEKLKKAL
jgi:tRNA(Ile)-lysidine synthase TilS/MesJ